MIIAHSTYSDGIYCGSHSPGPVTSRGGNAYWLDVLPHEAAYLTGLPRVD